MKTNRKKMLLSSIAMLLVALVALGSATYAWFTLNKTVYADGMQVEVAAAKGLVITGTNAAVNAASGWDSKYTFTDTTAKLNPASISVDAQKHVSANTVYTSQISADGKWEANKNAEGASASFGSESTITPAASGEAFTKSNYAAAYEIGVKSKDANDTLNGVNFTLDLEVTDTKVQDYVRVAVVEQASTAVAYATDSALKVFGNETTPKAYPSQTEGTPATAVSQTLNPITWTSMKSTGNAVDSNFSLGKVGENTNVAKWYTILVWFEGEDGDCVTDNAVGSFKLKANFTMA